MAGTPIPDARNIITVEETDFNSALSEAMLQRIGAVSNFIANRIYDRQLFTWNGNYRVTDYSAGLNGYRYIKRLTKISYYVLTNHVAGTSGTSSVNFEVYDETNTLLGNLFSIPPSIDSAAGNRAIIGRDVDGAADILAGANKIVGVLNFTELPSGYSLVPLLTGAQVGARNLLFELVLKEQ